MDFLKREIIRLLTGLGKDFNSSYAKQYAQGLLHHFSGKVTEYEFIKVVDYFLSPNWLALSGRDPTLPPPYPSIPAFESILARWKAIPPKNANHHQEPHQWETAQKYLGEIKRMYRF